MRAAGLRLAAAIALLVLAATPRAADWKPDQPVEIVIGTSAGSGSDSTGRWIQRRSEERRVGKECRL